MVQSALEQSHIDSFRVRWHNDRWTSYPRFSHKIARWNSHTEIQNKHGCDCSSTFCDCSSTFFVTVPARLCVTVPACRCSSVCDCDCSSAFCDCSSVVTVTRYTFVIVPARRCYTVRICVCSSVSLFQRTISS